MRKIFFTTYNVTFFSTFLVILALVFSSTNLTHASKIGVPPNFIPGTGLSNGLVGYWTFDGKDTPWTSSTAATTLDKSGNGNTGTLTNMAQATSPVAGKIGQGLSFDGSNDYVSAAVNLSGTNIASLSFWMKWNAYANDDDFAFEYTNNANAKNGIMIDPNESSTSKFVILMTKDSPQLYNGGSITRPSAGVWHHYGVILDRTTGSNNGVTVYVDGVVQSMTQTQSGGFGSNNFDNSSLYFMSRGGSSLFGAGSLDDVRVYNRALSATEVSQLYNTGISKFDVSPTKSLTSGLVGYWTFDGKDTPWTSSTAATTLDKSGNGGTGTLTNMAQATSPVAGKIGQGLSFDGSNDYVAIPTNVSLSGTQQASVSLWLNQPSYTLGSADIIFESTGDISAETVGFYLTSSDTTTGCSSNQIITAVRGDVGYNLQCYSPPTVNQWHHFVAVYDKADASSEGNLYIDGVLQSRTQSGLAANNTNNFGNKAFYIGARSGGTAPMQGKIDDVRIYNRALSATEVSQLYNSGISKFDVSPTKSLTSGLVGYWTFDGKDTPWTSSTAATTLDKSGNGGTGTLTNMAQATSPIAGKIGQGLSFDGVNDYVSGGDTDVFTFSTSNTTDLPFTFSAWVKRNGIPPGSSHGFAIVSKTGDDAFTLPFEYIFNITTAEKISVNLYDNAGNHARGRTSDSAYSSDGGNWAFYVATYDGSGSGNGIILYRNGVSVASTATTDGTYTAMENSTEPLRIGTALPDDATYGNMYMNGSLDDVRIYNRVLSATEISQLYNIGR